MNFSLLMAVYYRDDVHALDAALLSVANSSLLPSRTVIVLDGPVSAAHEGVISKYSEILSVVLVRLPCNVGLGLALNAGLEKCETEWIARFDSDDICCPDRFECQIRFLVDNQHVDICSGWIAEFDADPTAPHSIRRVPETHDEIIALAKWRNPFNHMAIMFRKSAVDAAGRYQSDYLYEDFALWVRMFVNGAISANIGRVLVHVRTGNGMFARRGGLRYARAEYDAHRKFAELGFLSYFELARNITIRIPVRVVPSSWRRWIYSVVLREGVT